MARPYLVLLSLALLGACQTTTPTVDDLRVHLWDRARETFDERRAVLDNDARRALQSMIEQAATRLVADHASADARHAAEDQVRKLAMEVATEADRGAPGDRGVIEVVEKDVRAIRDKVCPLYPFCK